eukprot:1758684-Alexandrium_andersonii.AAC.1
MGIRSLGDHGRALLKTDSELALVDLRRGAAGALVDASGLAGLQVVLGGPLAREPQSNRPMENAIRQLQG